jgi:schlafen family protein
MSLESSATAQAGAVAHCGAVSRKQRLRRRVVIFSWVFGIATLVAGAIPFCLVDVYLPVGRLSESNSQTLQRVRCDAHTCDMGDINADPEFKEPDYILDKSTYYLLGTPTEDIPGFPLRYADTAFMRRFQTPASFPAPDGETWRIYSEVRSIGSARVAVLVGYAEKATWKIELPTNTPVIDNALRQEVDEIAGALRQEDDRIEFGGLARRRVAVDGYVVSDIATDEVLFSGYSMPMYYPHSRRLPRPGTRLFRAGRQIYIVRADSSDRLLVVNTSPVGDLLWLLGCSTLLLGAGFSGAYASGRTFLRKYFLLSDSSAHSYADALQLGEGLTVEFKRSISFDVQNSVDRVLETIAAFANTAGGTIFIGIEDNGKVHGLRLEGAKVRDALNERIHQSVRNRVRPSPVIRIAFLEAEGQTVCRIFVPRGEQPLHGLDGLIYVRDGPSDIKAPPERIVKLVEEYAV